MVTDELSPILDSIAVYYIHLHSRRLKTCDMASYDDNDGDDFGTSGSYSVVGSFPKEFGYSEDPEDLNCHVDEQKPKILLMGLRRSGKSSILKVVFHKMSPNETLFLESTNKVVKDNISNSSFVQFQVWDFPGQIDFFAHDFDPDQIFSGCGSLGRYC